MSSVISPSRLLIILFREIEDKKLLMKISIPIEKEMLLSRIEYKYAVLHSIGEKVSWEFVPKKVTAGQCANRILSVPKEHIQQHAGKFNSVRLCLVLCFSRY